ncbi:MAG: hypothetical protein QOF98_3512, partial [Streptomyces sp.]|nr:hypothetical protein [Streptomyces sp.]
RQEDPGAAHADANDTHAMRRAIELAARGLGFTSPNPAVGCVIADATGRIALGAAAICSVLDPGRLVLAGEVGQGGGSVLAARVSERLARISPLRTEVLVTAVEGGPILRGAVIMAMDAAQEALFAPAG